MIHLDRIIRFVKAAGAGSETETDRNGFLTYHAESHALGMGLAAGFMAVSFSKVSLLGLVYGAAVHGRIAQSNKKRRLLLVDLRDEPHYCLVGVVAGGVLGALIRVLMGRSVIPDVAGLLD